MVIDQLIKAATEIVQHENGPTTFFNEYDFASLLIREVLDRFQNIVCCLIPMVMHLE